MSIPHKQYSIQQQGLQTVPRSVRAIRNAFVADALAMPAHWYYRRTDIRKDFPDGFKQFHPAPARHPGAIMSLHSKRHGGRQGSQANNVPEVVGNVILKGKAHLWDQSGIHYHHDMQAGENTLNAHTVLWMFDAIRAAGQQYDESIFLNHYIQQMTADPANHPDTYAESYHRGFFAHLAAGRAAHQCAAVTHDTPSIGGLVRIGPLALWAMETGHSLVEIKSMAALHLKLTHPDNQLIRVCFQYLDLLNDLWQSDDLESRQTLLRKVLMQVAGKHFKRRPAASWADDQVIGGLYSSACYISDSWPGILYLANKYPEDTLTALQVNTELGGDNVQRGFVFATILAMVNGQELDDLYKQLACRSSLDQTLEDLKLLS